MIKLVAIGRLMKTSEMFTHASIDQYHRSIEARRSVCILFV
jgi:hypothetical protein